MNERTGVIKFKGNPMTLVGGGVKVGDPLPPFCVTANDLSPIKAEDFKGRVLAVVTVPSVDTPVCATETRRFNKNVADLSGDVRILVVSLDLPFAQKRFCAAEGIDRVSTASDYKDHKFGEAFGARIKELGLLTRAVFVFDKQGQCTYAEYVPEVTQEPNYDAAFAAVKAAL
ncbi:MAG: thiol peroxidase [Planctomycetota bacterium]